MSRESMRFDKIAATLSALTIVINTFVYYLAKFIDGDGPFHDVSCFLDDYIQFSTPWIIIYVLSFPFWMLSFYYIGSHSDRDYFYKFITIDIICKILAFIMFVVYPTDCLARPEFTNPDGVLTWICSVVYAADTPINLFPSLHVQYSLMCAVGIYKVNDAPKWLKYATVIFVILIILATQFTKQHYIIDILGSIEIMIIAYFINKFTKTDRILHRILDKYEK
ncbi:MAG: phosphatase PAP2 family protein [Clostridia bacterium]|nr:phosphatase PAP2 family protein [Clostridia bacterium]